MDESLSHSNYQASVLCFVCTRAVHDPDHKKCVNFLTLYKTVQDYEVLVKETSTQPRFTKIRNERFDLSQLVIIKRLSTGRSIYNDDQTAMLGCR